MKFEYKFGTDDYLLVIEDEEKLARALDVVFADKYSLSCDERDSIFRTLNEDDLWGECFEEYRDDLKAYFEAEAEMEYEAEQRKMEEEENDL